MIKTLEELQDSGCPPQDLNQDPVALSSELTKKDRELTAKVINNYTRKDGGCRQKVLTVFISEWERIKQNLCIEICIEKRKDYKVILF